MKKLILSSVLLILFTAALCYGEQFTLMGNVADLYGQPIGGAQVVLQSVGASTQTDAKGAFTLEYEGPVSVEGIGVGFSKRLRDGVIQFSARNQDKFDYVVYNLMGKRLTNKSLQIRADGMYDLWLGRLVPRTIAPGVYFVKLRIQKQEVVYRVFHSTEDGVGLPPLLKKSDLTISALSKKTSETGDSLTVSKDGFITTVAPIENAIGHIGEVILKRTFPADQVLATWYMVNVNYGEGQGDAHVITIGNKVIMIDAGKSAEATAVLIPFLRSKNIRTVHEFFLSHPHPDHHDGIWQMWSDGIKIEKLYMTLPPRDVCDAEIPWGCAYNDVVKLKSDASTRGVTVTDPPTGFSLSLPNFSRMEILFTQKPPASSMISPDINDMSNVIKWWVGDNTVLFTGDLNVKLGHALAGDPRMKADLMKVPHHGASGIAPNTFFNMVAAKTLLVPGPKTLWCGDKSAQARNWGPSNGATTYVNGLHGTVTVKFYSDRYVVSAERTGGCN
ncbi:MAG: MBL fold metallo-hydrolase [Fibrobacteria bacterium]|nr:MBL fold metallo-hydrolase [Fibrobacteria bacterium]